MKCFFEYCTHNRHYLCLLDEIQINSRGMCDMYDLMVLDEDFLEMEKQWQRQEMAKRQEGEAQGSGAHSL